jgi:hypothetical protein
MFRLCFQVDSIEFSAASLWAHPTLVLIIDL